MKIKHHFGHHQMMEVHAVAQQRVVFAPKNQIFWKVWRRSQLQYKIFATKLKYIWSVFSFLGSQNLDAESESCSSSMESATEEDRVALQISDKMKTFLEFDQKMITKMDKLVNLPAKIPVVTILENYVKYYSIKLICEPSGTDVPRRRNSSAKMEKKEKDYDKIKNRFVGHLNVRCRTIINEQIKHLPFSYSINLRKEVADGLRIYFDFLLKDYLLYNQEKEQANILLSEENLKNFTYIGSERQ